MATALLPLTAPPPKGRTCIFCRKAGQDFDLITHSGSHGRCFFRRLCYPKSTSAKTGDCQSCDTFLHRGRAGYVISDADSYRMQAVARCFRVAQRAAEENLDFDRKNVIRSSSWHGRQKPPSDGDVQSVRKFIQTLQAKRFQNRIC